jgi:tRNA pseudouridine(38-40) synthase
MFAAKLELTQQQLDMDEHEFDTKLSDHLNTSLPSDIRALTCSRAKRNFYARGDVAVRQYEYLIPLHVLHGGESAIPLLHQLLQIYVGTNSMHNFGVANKTPQKRADDQEEDCSSDHYRTLYYIRADRLHVNHKNMARITLMGESFMRYQIRSMVGTAIAVINGKIDQEYLELAVKSSVNMPTPLAPPHSLILTGFDMRNIEHQKLWQKESLRQNQIKFLETEIYPHMMQVLEQNDVFNTFVDSQLQLFYDALEKEYHVSSLMNQARADVVVQQQDRNVKDEKHKTFVLRHIEVLRLMTEKERSEHLRMYRLWDGQKDVFPRGFVLMLCTRYGLHAFMERSIDLVNGLAKAISDGELKAVEDSKVYFDYINNLGVENVIQKGKEISTKAFLWSK